MRTWVGQIFENVYLWVGQVCENVWQLKVKYMRTCTMSKFCEKMDQIYKKFACGAKEKFYGWVGKQKCAYIGGL